MTWTQRQGVGSFLYTQLVMVTEIEEVCFCFECFFYIIVIL